MFDMSEAQAAARLKRSPRTLAKWRKAGLIPFCRDPGGRIGYTEGQIAEIEYQARFRPDAISPRVLCSGGER